jgi:DNA-binding NarL/FixJ family response regulator
MSKTKLMIVDDQKIFRVLLHGVLALRPEFDLVGEASNSTEAEALARKTRPDVILMDIELGRGQNGVETGHRIKKAIPSTGIVLFSSHKSPEYLVKGPGWSYLVKDNLEDVDALIRAINDASWGRTVIDSKFVQELSERGDTQTNNAEVDPLEILQLACKGYDDQTIGSILDIRPGDVPECLNRVIAKVGITRNRDQDIRVDAIAAYMKLSEASELDDLAAEEQSAAYDPSDIINRQSFEVKRVFFMTLEGYNDSTIAEELTVTVLRVQDWRALVFGELGIVESAVTDQRVLAIGAFRNSFGEILDADPEILPTRRRVPQLYFQEFSAEHRQVLELAATGFENAAIAQRLNIDTLTVKEYLDITYYEMGMIGDTKIDPRLVLTRAFLDLIERSSRGSSLSSQSQDAVPSV